MAVGRNKEGECNVSSWCDIEAVARAMFIWRRTQVMLIQSVSHVTAAVAVGWNKHEQCDVNDWRNVVAVGGMGSYHWA